MHNTPQKGFSSLCFLNMKPLQSAKPTMCFFSNIAWQCQHCYIPCSYSGLARNSYSLPCMPLQHGRMRKEWLGSYCDIMNTWSCVKFTKQLSIMYVKHILENFSSLHFLNIWSSYLHLRLCWLSRPGNIVRITTFSVSLQMVVILQGCDSRQATSKL